MRHAGFPAVENGQAEVLVLGTLPGRLSLQAGEYYANPRNSFWSIMGRVLNSSTDVPYAKRKQVLTKNRVALWDVLAAARRPGSLDSSIVTSSLEPNDFRRFFRSHPRVRLVCFNGKKAADLYRRVVLPSLGTEFANIRYENLPSTSPAHAAMSFEKKLARWTIVRSQLGSNNRLQRSAGRKGSRGESGEKGVAR
ncbi:MAG: DNA-deoxyinosine glycosylase [Burkholderiales bacterium]